MKKVVNVVLLGMVMFASQACIWGAGVGDDEVGIITKGGRVSEVVGPSIVWRTFDYYAEINKVNVGVQTFTFEDNSIYTQDKQTVGATIGISVRRKADEAETMFKNYRVAALNDAELQRLVNDRMSRIVKSAFSARSIDSITGTDEQVKGSRDLLADEIKEKLAAEVADFNVIVIDVGVNNVDPSEAYQEAMNNRTKAEARAELAKAEKAAKILELDAEKAETEKELEVARRDNLVAQEKGKAYEKNPILLQLELARINADAIKGAKLVVLPAESTMFTKGLLMPDPAVVTGN